jgi:hypothetical protein
MVKLTVGSSKERAFVKKKARCRVTTVRIAGEAMQTAFIILSRRADAEDGTERIGAAQCGRAVKRAFNSDQPRQRISAITGTIRGERKYGECGASPMC